LGSVLVRWAGSAASDHFVSYIVGRIRCTDTEVFQQRATAAATKGWTACRSAGLVDRVTPILTAGDRVRMSGLGTIEVKDRPARMGRNPATGAAIQIAASRKVAFRAAKELKEAV
jgi:DNA-binding protein HU-beta